ncbi:MAG: polysaccharide biosynthesis C-terminal domain-containing protein [Chloroflexota bacterium]
MSVSAVASAPALETQAPSAAAKLSLGPTAALLFAARCLQYIVYGVTGVILARSLGADGRGIYGLINETAEALASWPGLGLEMAAMYLVGQRMFPLQRMFSNSLTWSIGMAVIAGGLIAAALLSGERLLGMDARDLSIALAGACLMTITDGACEFLLPLGKILPYTAVKVLIPVVRLIGITAIAIGVGLSIQSAAGIWLLSFALGSAVTIFFLSRHVQIKPGFDSKSFKAQASYGIRGHTGWILQALNHRLDVFLVGGFIGAEGVGRYLVGVNLAELSWWVPLTLGTVLFPKASAMDGISNFAMSAATCRRTLVVTALATLGLLIICRPAIPLVYGSDFGPSVGVFLILAPSGVLYTVHKVLGSSLSANGMPQSVLFGGMVSLPATIGLNIALIPYIGIEGAAIASDIAYLINSAVVLAIFRARSGISIRETLVFNRKDWAVFKATTAGYWKTYVLRQPATLPAGSE